MKHWLAIILLLVATACRAQVPLGGITVSGGSGSGPTNINLSGTTTSYSMGSAVVGQLTTPINLTITNNTGASFNFYAVYSPIYGAVQPWDNTTSWPFSAPVFYNGNYYNSNISNNVGNTPPTNWTLVGASSHEWTTIWYDGDALAAIWNPTSGACHQTPLTGSTNSWTGINWAIASNATCTLPIYLRPTAIGASSGHVYFADNNGNVLSTLTLSGTGTAPTISHSATLPNGITNPLTDTVFSTTYTAPSSCSFTDTTLSGLQSHINGALAAGGQTFCVAAGTTLNGTLTISNCPTATDILTTANFTSLPAAGTRVGPSNASNMFALNNAASGNNMLVFTSTACKWRVVGVEFNGTYSVGGGQVMATTDPASTDITFDRIYAHWATSLGTNWLQMEGTRIAVIDSYCALDNSGETQCIATTNGPGPFKVVNNYLQAPGENYFFGGGDATVYGTIPSDIELRNNYLTKPLTWNFNCMINGGGFSPNNPGSNPCGSTVWDGGGASGVTLNTNTGGWSSATNYAVGNVAWSAGDPYVAKVANTNVTPIGNPSTWQFLCDFSGCTTSGGGIWRPVKNCGEIKKGQRWLEIGSIFENNWLAGQDGTCKLWETANQSGSDVSAVNQNGTFEYNIIRNAGNGMSQVGSSYAYGSQGNSHIIIQNNLFYNIGGNEWGVPNSNLMVAFGAGAPSRFVGKTVAGYAEQHNTVWVSDVAINHNTFLDYTNSIIVYDAGIPTQIYGLQLKYNIFNHGSFGLDNGGTIGDTNNNFNSVWPSAQTDTASNVLVAVPSGYVSAYTANFLQAANTTAVGFANVSNKDFRLCTGSGVPDPSCTASSTYHNAAADGKDYGADVTTINLQTACTISGTACNPHP